MIISWDEEKAFYKTKHPVSKKVQKRLGIQGVYLNIIKAIYSKLLTNINLNEEKLKAILLKLEPRQGYLFSTYLFKRALEFSARAIRQLKIKVVQTGKEFKVSLFSDDMIV